MTHHLGPNQHATDVIGRPLDQAPRTARVNAATSTPSEPQHPPRSTGDPKRWHALAVTQLAAFMSLLDVSIVNVALPSIERGLHTPAGTAQWVISGYALTLGLVLVPAGRLGDALGRRRLFLVASSRNCSEVPNADAPSGSWEPRSGWRPRPAP